MEMPKKNSPHPNSKDAQIAYMSRDIIQDATLIPCRFHHEVYRSCYWALVFSLQHSHENRLHSKFGLDRLPHEGKIQVGRLLIFRQGPKQEAKRLNLENARLFSFHEGLHKTLLSIHSKLNTWLDPAWY